MRMQELPGDCQVCVFASFGMSFDDIMWNYDDPDKPVVVKTVTTDQVIKDIKYCLTEYGYHFYLATTTTTQIHAEEALRKCGFKVIKQVTAYDFNKVIDRKKDMEKYFGWLPEDMKYKHTFWFATREELLKAIED